MPVWDDVIPAAERAIFDKGGMGASQVDFGHSPAIVVVDMTYAFVDSTYLLGHSETGYPAVKAIKRLLDVARPKGIPVFYSTSFWSDNPVERGRWKRSAAVMEALRHPMAHVIVEDIAPLAGEPVVRKAAPSAFFGTGLASMLIMNNVDTVIVTGMVTSGCVYATAVDAFSYSFRTVIPEECVADRSEIGHKVSLFSLHMKYGDVMPLGDVVAHLADHRGSRT